MNTRTLAYVLKKLKENVFPVRQLLPLLFAQASKVDYLPVPYYTKPYFLTLPKYLTFKFYFKIQKTDWVHKNSKIQV